MVVFVHSCVGLEDDEGRTPLLMGVRNGHIAVVSHLVEKRANMELQTKHMVELAERVSILAESDVARTLSGLLVRVGPMLTSGMTWYWSG
eukprot:4941598-Amphidinium_carterae.1